MLASLVAAVRTLAGKPHRRRARARLGFEHLEPRQLMTVDMSIGAFSIGNTFIEINEQPGGILQTQVSLFVQLVNSGTTTIDLTNGTPNNVDDDPQMQFFRSTDGTLDAGDPLIETNRLSSISASLPTGQARQANFITGFELGPNDKFLFVRVDVTNLVAEDNENNNTESLGISVPHMNASGSNQPVRRRKTGVVDPLAGFLDGDSPDYNGGRIQANILDKQEGDSLRFLKSGRGADRLRLSGTTLKLGSLAIGTVTGNNTALLTIDFIAPVDRRVVQRALRRIAYRGLVDTVTTRAIEFQLRDGTGQLSNTDTKTVEFE